MNKVKVIALINYITFVLVVFFTPLMSDYYTHHANAKSIINIISNIEKLSITQTVYGSDNLMANSLSNSTIPKELITPIPILTPVPTLTPPPILIPSPTPIIKEKLDIKNNLLHVNQYSRPGFEIANVEGLVIHWISIPNTTEINNRDYWESLKDGIKYPGTNEFVFASAHFIVGLKGQILRAIPENEVAYHSGDPKKLYKKDVFKYLHGKPNSYTLGIEMTHIDKKGNMTDATYNKTVSLTAHLCNKYGLDPKVNLWRHFDITGKNCPKLFVDHTDLWEKFKADVEKRIPYVE